MSAGQRAVKLMVLFNHKRNAITKRVLKGDCTMKKEAMLYEQTGGGSVHCYLCSHHCRIDDGKWGFCGVRGNIKGRLYSSVYGEVIEANIESCMNDSPYKQLRGEKSYSVATVGCNFRCKYCKNMGVSHITKAAMNERLGYEQSPREIVKKALNNRCKSIFYNYTEPTVYFEYMHDIAFLAKKAGLKNIMATNGYMTKEAIDIIKPYIDVIKVDLKSFNEDFYVNVCSGRLSPVLDTIRYIRQVGLWQEIYTLIVPGSNDSENELSSMAEFIAGVGTDIPWHVIRPEAVAGSPKSPENPVEIEKLAKINGLRIVSSQENVLSAMA